MTTPGLPNSLHPGLTDQGYGTVVITRHYDNRPDAALIDHIVIDQADPIILITDDLLTEIHAGIDGYNPVQPFARIEPPPGAPPPVPWVDWHDHEMGADPWPCQPYLWTPDARYRCWHNWLLHIDAINQHVVYRIHTYDLERNAWRAAWPD